MEQRAIRGEGLGWGIASCDGLVLSPGCGITRGLPMIDGEEIWLLILVLQHVPPFFFLAGMSDCVHDSERINFGDRKR